MPNEGQKAAGTAPQALEGDRRIFLSEPAGKMNQSPACERLRFFLQGSGPGKAGDHLTERCLDTRRGLARGKLRRRSIGRISTEIPGPGNELQLFGWAGLCSSGGTISTFHRAES